MLPKVCPVAFITKLELLALPAVLLVPCPKAKYSLHVLQYRYPCVPAAVHVAALAAVSVANECPKADNV